MAVLCGAIVRTCKAVKHAFTCRHLAPVRYCVSPLLKNKPELVTKAREVYDELKDTRQCHVGRQRQRW